MKYILLICCLVCLGIQTYAQLVVRIDEDKDYIQLLEKRLKESKTDSAKAINALRLSYFYKKYQKMDLSKRRLDQGVALAKGDRMMEGIAKYFEAYSVLGTEDLAATDARLISSDSLLKDIHGPEAKKYQSGVWIIRGLIKQLQDNEKEGMKAYINHALPLAI